MMIYERIYISERIDFDKTNKCKKADDLLLLVFQR